jgi:hypothetical protein
LTRLQTRRIEAMFHDRFPRLSELFQMNIRLADLFIIQA